MPTSKVERVEAGVWREARLIEMVFPQQTNHYGTLFGGQALALMDKAAFVVASRYARRTVVTASSERCDFEVPVQQGQVVELIARVTETGRTSMVVEVELIAEDLLSGDRQRATRGRFVMVALDAHGRPTRVPPLEALSRVRTDRAGAGRNRRPLHAAVRCRAQWRVYSCTTDSAARRAGWDRCTTGTGAFWAWKSLRGSPRGVGALYRC